jgi:hypothetical protein
MKRFGLPAHCASFALLAALLSGCSFPVTYNTVQSMEVPTGRLTRSEAFSRVITLLIDQGYDIKNSNLDAGLVTTEYRKVASSDSSPPFDYYLQIRVALRETPSGQSVARLTPMVKEQNRLNAAAFTEHELSYYTGDPTNVRLITSQSPSGWRQLTENAYMGVVNDLADVAGVPIEDIHRNVTSYSTNALGAE